MKKYRVVTDNLDWLLLPRGTVFEAWFDIGAVRIKKSNGSTIVLERGDFLLAHKDWFQEIVDERKHYTMDDMIDFGRFVYDQVKPSSVPVDMILLDKWIQKAHPEDCVHKKE